MLPQCRCSMSPLDCGRWPSHHRHIPRRVNEAAPNGFKAPEYAETAFYQSEVQVYSSCGRKAVSFRPIRSSGATRTHHYLTCNVKRRVSDALKFNRRSAILSHGRTAILCWSVLRVSLLLSVALVSGSHLQGRFRSHGAHATRRCATPVLCAPSVPLQMALLPKSDDSFRAEKEEILSETTGLSASPTFALTAGELPADLLPFARLKHLGGVDAFLLEPLFHPTVWTKQLRHAVSADNEADALNDLLDACQALLVRSPSARGEAERRVVSRCIETLDASLLALSHGVVSYQERRLGELGLASAGDLYITAKKVLRRQRAMRAHLERVDDNEMVLLRHQGKSLEHIAMAYCLPVQTVAERIAKCERMPGFFTMLELRRVNVSGLGYKRPRRTSDSQLTSSSADLVKRRGRARLATTAPPSERRAKGGGHAEGGARAKTSAAKSAAAKQQRGWPASRARRAEQARQMAALRSQGVSSKTIACEMNVSLTCVYTRLAWWCAQNNRTRFDPSRAELEQLRNVFFKEPSAPMEAVVAEAQRMGLAASRRRLYALLEKSGIVEGAPSYGKHQNESL